MVKLVRRNKPSLVLTENNASNRHVGAHPAIPKFIRLFSIPILLFWIGLVVVLSISVPQLEVVGEQHSVSLAPDDAPSLQAMKRVGQVFNEFNSNSSAMIVLEGDAPWAQKHTNSTTVSSPHFGQTPPTSRTFRTSGVTR